VKCNACNGRGHITRRESIDIGGGWAKAVDTPVPCKRCRGDGTVESNTTAFALEAWRESLERGRRDLALAHVLDELSNPRRPQPNRVVLAAREWFIDVDALIDELRWSSRETVAILGEGGCAWWFGSRTAVALTRRKPSKSPTYFEKTRRSWVAFWDEVLPSVTPLLRVYPDLQLALPGAA
jgi:hypothetical protein